MPKKTPTGQLYPRHVKALARAVREAESWLILMDNRHSEIYEFEEFIRNAKEALREVREVAAQHANSRKYSSWGRLAK